MREPMRVVLEQVSCDVPNACQVDPLGTGMGMGMGMGSGT